MAKINNRAISDVLTAGMNNGLPWLAPFSFKNCNEYEPFLDVDIPVAFDSSIKRSEIPTNVKYLPYQDKHITFVEIRRGDIVISGRFSGCYMGVYWKNDKKYVCHIATGGGADRKCLGVFNDFDAEDKVMFKPSYIVNEFKDIGCIRNICQSEHYTFEPLEDIYGIISDDDEFYSVIMARKGRKYHVIAWAKWRIEGCIQILEEEFSLIDSLLPYLASVGEIINLSTN